MDINKDQLSVSIPYSKFQALLEENKELNSKESNRDEILKELETFLTYWHSQNANTFRSMREDFNTWNNNSRLRIQDNKVKIELL